MTKRRFRLNGKHSDCDGSRFIRLPHQVIESPAFFALNHAAKSLLIDIAAQYAGRNNGQMRTSFEFMKARGWKSKDTLTRATRELLEHGFIHQTVIGHRPNKASWYAVTWWTLDRHPGYDPGAAETFERSAYKRWHPAKIEALTPTIGPKGVSIGPTIGLEVTPTSPAIGPM